MPQIIVKAVSRQVKSHPEDVYWGIQIGPMFLSLGYKEQDVTPENVAYFSNINGFEYWPEEELVPLEPSVKDKNEVLE